MTANQIKKALVKAGIPLKNLEIERNSVEVCVGYYEWDRQGTKYGSCDREATEVLRDQIQKVLPELSHASSRQYGGWGLTPSIAGIDYSLDYCDVSSHHHW